LQGQIENRDEEQQIRAIFGACPAPKKDLSGTKGGFDCLQAVIEAEWLGVSE
jgi:hypothetical protein